MTDVEEKRCVTVYSIAEALQYRARQQAGLPLCCGRRVVIGPNGWELANHLRSTEAREG